MSYEKTKKKYVYDGPVMLFDYCIADKWHGETFAYSEGRAKSNLIYQFKVTSNRVPSSRIELPGKIVCVD